MHQSLDRTLVRLRNTRDLRAEMLLLASDLSEGPHTAMLIVRDPVVSEATVRAEWDRMLQAIRPDIGRRMVLEIESLQKASARQLDPDRIRVERPNFRHEVLRLILDAQLMHAEASTVRQLVGELGSSQTPVREAIMELLRAGMITRWTQGLQLNLQQLSRERLATCLRCFDSGTNAVQCHGLQMHWLSGRPHGCSNRRPKTVSSSRCPERPRLWQT